MALTDGQLRHFVDHGYIVVPGREPESVRVEALKAINRSLGQGIPLSEIDRFRARSWTPELRSSPVITELLLTPSCWELVEDLLGEGKAERPAEGQIALRFPGHDEEVDPVPHIDGRPLGWNGVTEYRNFTLLVGVFLDAVTVPDSGNLTVWPGTHRTYQDYFRSHGTAGIRRGAMPDVHLPRPEQLQVGAGDIVLAHYQLGHSVARHRSSSIRYAVYFRVRARGHESRMLECLTDIWLEYEGLRARVPVPT